MKTIQRYNRTFLVYEILFLVFLGLALLVSFEDTTMFHVEWPHAFQMFLRGYGVAILLSRIILDGTWKWREVLLAGLVCGGLILSWHHAGSYDQIMFLAILIIGAKDVPFDHIVKTYLAVSVPFLVFTVICSLTGHVENLIYHQASHGYKTRIAFGFVYPTDFCAHLLFLTLCIVWIRNFFLKYAEMIAIAAIGVFCYVFCDTRTTALLFWITAGILFAGRWLREKRENKARQKASESAYSHKSSMWKYEQKAISENDKKGENDQKKGKEKKRSAEKRAAWYRVLTVCCCVLPVFLAIVMIVLSRYYNPESGWMSRLNSMLNNRLYYGKMGFERYPVQALGQYVEMNGAGGHTGFSGKEYFFLDSSYVNILLRFGWVVLIGILLTLVILVYRACAARQWVRLLVLLVIILDCAIEHHLAEFYYHPFLMLLFAAGDLPSHRRLRPARENRRGSYSKSGKSD